MVDDLVLVKICFLNVLLQGSRALKIISDDEVLQANAKCYQWGHLAMTYTGIATLATLGDDLSRIDRKAIVDGEILVVDWKWITLTTRFSLKVLLLSRGRMEVLALPSKAMNTI